MSNYLNPDSVTGIGTKSAKADAYDRLVRGQEINQARRSGFDEGLISEMARREAALQSQADFARQAQTPVPANVPSVPVDPRQEAALQSQADFAGGLAGSL